VLGSAASIGAAGEASFDGPARSPLLYTNSVSWVVNPGSGFYDHGHARVVLRGADYKPESALLFGSSTEGENSIHIFSAYPNSGGWDITIRDGQDLDASGQTLSFAEEMAFMFLCIPTNTPGLIGGQINGSTGGTIIGAGGYTMTRTAAGNYELTIPGKTGASGMLLLTVAGAMSGSAIPNLADRAVLSYEYAAGKFVIQSREAVSGGNPFGLAYNQRDTDFVFAWVDFSSPLSTVTAPFGRPTLTIAPSGSNVILTWPNSEIGYLLESTTSLVPATWSPVGGTPTLNVNKNTKSLTLPVSGNRYFRLKRI
jgi:hypothetical protein